MCRRPLLASLVIPAYGVAPYLPRFLSSFDAQDHPHHRLQVVLVLDGVCDDSPRACRSWAWRTGFDVEIIETNNGGQRRARNLGMEWARGQWIGFPDPDDQLAPDFLAWLLAARRCGGVLLTGCILIHQDGVEIPHPLDSHSQGGTTRVDAARQSQVIQLSVHECLIRAGRAFATRFPEDREVSISEDVPYLGRTCSRWGWVAHMSEAVYYYDKRVASDSAVQIAQLRPGRYIAQMRMRYHAPLDATGGAPWAQQMILYDLGWHFGVVDAGRIPTDSPGLGQVHAAEMRGLAQCLDAEQILCNPWGNLGARDQARLLLWKGRPEVAVVCDDEVIELRTVESAGRQAESLRYVGIDVGWVLTGAEAAQCHPDAGVPHIPLWSRRPRSVEPRPTGTVRLRGLLRHRR